jgi:hypothetical protein
LHFLWAGFFLRGGSEYRRSDQALPPTAGRLHHAVIRVYEDAGNVIEAHEHAGELKSGEADSES